MSRDLEQGRKLDSKATSGADVDVDAEHDPEVARRASNAGLRREVQKKGSDGIAAGQVHAAAERGAATPAGPLPHMDKIQASFGAHDVSGIQAHVDGKSTRAMGAEAYASGNHVVFGRQPDLHTAAHEAAHVVQQATGDNLKGVVGAEGDAHERQADEVADRVVAGKPAGDLLGPVTARPASTQAVQRKPAEKTADPTAAHDKSDQKSYASVQSALTLLAKDFHAWIPKLDSAMGMDTNGPAGAGPAANIIFDIFNAAKNDAESVGDLIYAADKGERTTLSPEVKLAQGACSRWWIEMTKASHWLTSHGHEKGAADPDSIRAIVDGYTDKIGLEGTKLELDSTTPQGDEKAMSKAMIDDQLTALEAAIASVKSGNANDAARITSHTRYLDNVGPEHAAEIKSHKSKLKHLLKELDEVRAEKPEVGDKLGEAYLHLTKLVH
jgi:hypothetical protein